MPQALPQVPTSPPEGIGRNHNIRIVVRISLMGPIDAKRCGI
jgi:hypothetical protein